MVNENILDEDSQKATTTLMQLAIFLVLYQVSKNNNDYISLKLDILNSIVITGGVSKVLSQDDIDKIVKFFYKKILHFNTIPAIIIDREYKIWTLGMEEVHSV